MAEKKSIVYVNHIVFMVALLLTPTWLHLSETFASGVSILLQIAVPLPASVAIKITLFPVQSRHCCQNP